MKILAVDTSTSAASIALLDGERVMTEWTLQSLQTHNRRLLKSIEFHLKELGWPFEQLDAFAVGIGPGSFTGLRIGVTTVKTLAWATGKPFVAIPSLDALAAACGFSVLPVCPLIDARRNEVYFALYRADGMGRIDLQSHYQVASPERIMEKIQGPTIFCGDAWPLCRKLFSNTLGDWAVGAPAAFHVIRASFVGELARKRFQGQQTDNPATCIPCYVRPSEAEIRCSERASPLV